MKTFHSILLIGATLSGCCGWTLRDGGDAVNVVDSADLAPQSQPTYPEVWQHSGVNDGGQAGNDDWEADSVEAAWQSDRVGDDGRVDGMQAGNDDRPTGNDDRPTGNDDRPTGNDDRPTGNEDAEGGQEAAPGDEPDGNDSQVDVNSDNQGNQDRDDHGEDEQGFIDNNEVGQGEMVAPE